MKNSITAVIITKNEDDMIANCINTLQWCESVIVLDNLSSDNTIEIAKQNGAEVLSTDLTSFAEMRTSVLPKVSSEWVLYIDADERITPQLAKEIQVQIETSSASALKMKRDNMMYGKFFHHGGWGTEFVVRAFRVSALEGWQGKIHESPMFNGEVAELHFPLLHFTHRNTVDGLQKTIAWTPIEAELLVAADFPPIRVSTLFRKGVMEVLRRAVFRKGYQDGVEGWIEAVVQGINRVLVYIQVWELQQRPSLKDKYQAEEVKIAADWKKST